MSKRMGFIGGGNMATAIIKGIIAKDSDSKKDVMVYDISSERKEYFTECGVTFVGSIKELVLASEYVYLCVKPQNFGEVLAEINGLDISGKVFVSIAAGITDSYIKKAIGGEKTKIILVMPNTPLMLGEGATALSCNENVDDDEFSQVKTIFANLGVVERVERDKMNEAIAVNGSTPAFVYLFAKTVAEHADKLGISYENAMNLFSQTLIGSAKMLMESGKTADELITMVSSKGGTTLEGLKALRENSFEETIVKGMNACVRRAEELSKINDSN